jgi:hypothetical protein
VTCISDNRRKTALFSINGIRCHYNSDNEEHSIGGARPQRKSAEWERPGAGRQRMTPLLERWIPFPRVLHPYPHARFAATHPK